MHAENSESRLNAKKAADLLCGFFPRSAASDPEIFLAGLTAVLEVFPPWVRERAVDPARGIPADHSFLPDLASVRKFCQALVDEHRRSEELHERYARPKLADPYKMPQVKNAATYSALCERFGIPGIPPGWDAIDVTRGAAKYGDQFPHVVAQMLTQTSLVPKSAFAGVVDKAKAAMEARQAECSNIDPPFGIGED